MDKKSDRLLVFLTSPAFCKTKEANLRKVIACAAIFRVKRWIVYIWFFTQLLIYSKMFSTQSLFITQSLRISVSVSVWVNCEHWSSVAWRHCHHTCLLYNIKYSDMVLLAISGNKISHSLEKHLKMLMLHPNQLVFTHASVALWEALL